MKKTAWVMMSAAVLAIAWTGCQRNTVTKSQREKQEAGSNGAAPATQSGTPAYMTQSSGYSGAATQPTGASRPTTASGLTTASGPASQASTREAQPYKPHYTPAIGRYGGRIVEAEISEPNSFNPITAGETSTTMYTDLIFPGLTRTDPWTYEVLPELATEWTHDESGLVWTVKLRSNVEWSDGEPFTADDVLFTYDTIYDKRYICSTRDIITGPNGERWKLEAVDGHTVQFTLYDRNAIFPLLLASSIIPKHKYKDLVDSGKFNDALGTNSRPEDLVGTGPFLLDHYDTAQQVVMKRNPRYYQVDAKGQALPYLDQLIFLVVPDINATILKFQQKETDVVVLRGVDYPTFEPKQKDDDFTIYKLGPSDGAEFIFFNMNTGTNPNTEKPYVEPYKLAWFRDVRFRQAILARDGSGVHRQEPHERPGLSAVRADQRGHGVFLQQPQRPAVCL